MLRRTTRVLAASILLAAAAPGAHAAPAQITDGTSNTILLPEAVGAQAVLGGTGKLRVEGVTRRGPFPATLTFDVEAGTFSLLVEEEVLLIGHLVAKGTKGNRFRLFLDAVSRDLFTDRLAKLGRGTTGRASGAVLGESSKLELTLDETAATLKLKCNVLTESLGEIVFKANLTGEVEL